MDFKNKTRMKKKIKKKTRMKKKIKNKTFKYRGGFARTICIDLKKVDDQNDLACELLKNDSLHFFIVDLLWNILTKIHSILDDEEFDTIITKNIIEKRDTDSVITDIGFKNEEVRKIIKLVQDKKQREFFALDFLSKKKHSTTACFARLNNPYFQSLYIRKDSTLFSDFISKLRQIFNLPESFNEADFLELYNDDPFNKIKQKSFDMLIVKILHTSNNKSGIIQLNYGREIFTRKNLGSEYIKTADPIPKCFNDIAEYETDKIYGVKNSLDISDTFVKSIFNKYDRNLLGGVSGSSYYLFFLVTKILKYPITRELLSRLLCITVLDYVPLWHSLEEILLTSSIEYEVYGFPRYTIDQDPLAYFKDVVCQSAPQ